MAARSDLDLLIDRAKLNPMAVQKGSIQFLEKVRGGEVEIVDASNAFVYLGEMAATMFVNAVRKNEISVSKQYPELAQTRADLYHHMSTTDYIGTFANPSTTTLVFNFSKDELIAKSVPTGISGVRKLVIGRDTQVMAGAIPFTLQYPIEIRILPHGGFQIVYDNSLISPLQTLETNNVEWAIDNYNIGNSEYVQILVPVYQMLLKSYTTALSAAKVFDKTYGYDDRYYHCRVYTSNEDGTWTEIKTTHSDQVFNPQEPTALLRVLDDNKLNVSIPQIYYSTGMVTRELRIDIYSTKGVLEIDLSTYEAGSFIPFWRDLNNDDKRKFTAPVATITDGFIVASTIASGGSNEISFEKLKERVINNALGPIDLPITNVQIQSQLDRMTDAGFSCVTVQDNVTTRLYLATRELPAPDIAEVSTGVGSNVVTLMKTTNEILTSADVVDNGERITILPTTLYKNEGGFLSIITSEERDAILSLEGDLRVEKVTNGQYLYTPFHYVYDFAGNVFTVRPYYFGEPKITRRFYKASNGTLGVGVSSSSHDLRRTDNGWALRVMTNSTDSLKALDDDAVVAQLAYVPLGEAGRCYKNGTLIGRDPSSKEWIFEFQFDSTWDVAYNGGTKEHSLYLDGFEIDGISPHPYPVKLNDVFDIFYGVLTGVVETGDLTTVDQDMGMFLFDDPITGLYHEQVTMTLGYELSGLWARARSTIGEESYLKYDEDIPKRYTANEPARNPDQSLQMEKDADGRWVVIYAHKAGDIKYLEDGITVDWLHRIGQTVLQDGVPIVVSPRTITRQVELCLFDGVYYFATAQTDIDYKTTVPLQIVEWVNTTLAPIRKKVLEQTQLKFHPKATIGRVQAIVDSSEIMSMEAAQSFEIVYYVTKKVAENLALQAEIRRTTRRTITELLREPLVTRDAIERQLKAIGGDDVIGVDVAGLGGVADYRVVSMADDTSRITIGKKLVSLPNKTYSVEDRIDIQFKLHALPE